MARPTFDVKRIPRSHRAAAVGTRAAFAIRRPPSAGDGSGLALAKDTKPLPAKEGWTNDAYSYVEAVGELGFAVNLMANTLAECKIRPEVRVPGTDEWQETDDPRVLRVLAAFRPPEGGHDELLRQAAMHHQIAGESYLFGMPVVDEFNRAVGFLWEFLSTIELRVEGNKILRDAWGGSKGRTEVAQDAYVARYHVRDARYSGRADSPVRRVLPICRELVLLTQVVDAVARSRIPAGLFYVPWEMTTGPFNDWENPGNADTGPDEWEEELDYHLNSPFEDRTAPSSLHPLLSRGPSHIKGTPAKDLMGLVDLGRPLDGIFKELRQECLDRLAGALDMPREALTGKSSLAGLGGGNVALSIDADLVSKHVAPMGRRIINGFMTTAFLRPMLTVFEGMTAAEAEWFRFAVDLSPIASEADLSANAKDGVELDILSDEAWLRANGFDEGDAAPPEQRLRRQLDALVLANPPLAKAIFPVLYPDNPDIERLLKKWDESAGNAGARPSTAPSFPFLSDDSPARLVAVVNDHELLGLARAADQSIAAVQTSAADRVVAGLKARNQHGIVADLEGLPAAQILRTVGQRGLDAAGLTSAQLFGDHAWRPLIDSVVPELAQRLIDSGDDPEDALRAASTAGHELTAALGVLTHSSLQRVLPPTGNGTRVDSDLVMSTLLAGDLARS